MIKSSQLPWIHIGYELFALEGPTGLKVEVMARKVNKSKSSFYHHFADLEVFTEILLQYHLERSQLIARQESECQNVIPELLEVLVEVKEDLFFNRQLRINRSVPAFQACFEKASQQVGGAILEIWAKELGLNNNSHLAQLVLNLSLENFYLQITPETLTYDWLYDYVQGLKNMVKEFKKQKI